MADKKVWEKLQYNYVLNGDGFFVSYNPNPSANFLAGAIDSLLGGSGESETALVKGGKFYILLGDHREAYEKMIDSFDMCLAYFVEHRDEVNHTSDIPAEEASR